MAIFCDHLVHCVDISNIFSRLYMLYQEKSGNPEQDHMPLPDGHENRTKREQPQY
jgi:hypothetical protein